MNTLYKYQYRNPYTHIISLISPVSRGGNYKKNNNNYAREIKQKTQNNFHAYFLAFMLSIFFFFKCLPMYVWEWFICFCLDLAQFVNAKQTLQICSPICQSLLPLDMTRGGGSIG